MHRQKKDMLAHTQSLWAFIWFYLRNKKIYLTSFVLTALMWSVDISLTPYLLKLIIDTVVTFSSNTQALLHALILPASIYALMTVLINLNFRMYDYANLQLYPYLRASIERDLLRYLLEHSYTFFHSTSSGALTKKITDLMENIEPLINIPNEWFYPRVLAAAIASVTLSVVVHPIFGFILLSWAILFVFLSYLAAKKAEGYSRHFSENISKLSGAVSDSVGNVMSIKLFDNAKSEVSTIDGILNDVVYSDKKLSWFNLKINLIQGTCCFDIDCFNVDSLDGWTEARLGWGRGLCFGIDAICFLYLGRA